MKNANWYVVTMEVRDSEGDEVDYTIEESLTLREAIKLVTCTRTNLVDGVECVEPSDSGPRPSWITIYNSMEFETGCTESRSLRFLSQTTNASRKRIARLLGAR